MIDGQFDNEKPEDEQERRFNIFENVCFFIFIFVFIGLAVIYFTLDDWI